MSNLTNIQLANFLKKLKTTVSSETTDVVQFTEGNKQTLEHLRYNPDTDKVEADRAIETTLNSLYLGDQHKMSSGSENIYFTNLTSKVNFYPMWGGIKDQSVVENQTDDGVYVPTARVFSSYGVAKLGGDPVLDTAIPYDGDNFFPFNISGLGITTVVAEVVPAHIRLKYELSVNGTPVYDQILTHTGLVANQTLSWFFDHPLDIVGSPTTFNHASIRKIDTKEQDLGLLLVCQGSNETTWGGIRYQTNVQNRLFQDKTIAYVDDLETLDVVGYYDLYVDPSYVGTDSDGTNLRPYTILATAIAASSPENKIFLKGDNITTEIILPHSLSFYGIDGTKIRYAAYVNTNTNLFKFIGTDNTSVFIFKNIEFNYAGEFAINITGGSASVDIIDCTFSYNGWNGTNFNTILSTSDSSVPGYDSTQTELQNFYATSSTSNGGAMKIEKATNIQIVGNKVLKNLRAIKVTDCGINGNGFITRNVSAQNIETGIYLAAGSLLGCQNITVTMNFSSYNSNNGLLVVGGINNKFSQNEVNGNWNAGFCAWSAGNTTLRDCGLYNNNRSAYTGIGNNGDAKASIQINENFDNDGTIITINSNAQFICEILDTQVHYTGVGSNTNKTGFLITSDVGNLANNDKNIIKIDDVGFIGQDYAIDLSEVDINNLRLSLGDNSYQSIGINAVKAPIAGNYNELPFSNHVMSVPVLDVVVDTLKQSIYLKDGIGGNVINTYNVNDLQSIINGSKVDIIQSNSDKIQLRGLTYSNVYINGVIAGNSLNTMNDSLNAAFNMDLIEYKEFFTSEVGLNSGDLILPSQANAWYISYGSNSLDNITSSGITADIKDQQPFYNGNSLEKGHEFLWTHDNTGSYILGIYTGSQTVQSETNIFNSNNWNVGFRYVRNSGRISGSDSVGVSINSNNDVTTNQWDVTNNTVLALRYGKNNILYLLDITDGKELIIGQSNLPLIGDSVTISFGGENQPNAKFPIMIERTERWSIVHDFDNSENNEWIDGIEPLTILKSNMSISPGEKFTWSLPANWTNRYYAIDYTGPSSGETSTNSFMTNRWRWHSSYTLQHATSQGWSMNTSNSLYDSGLGQWNPTHGNSTLVSYRHLSDNTLEMWDETYGEKIMTLVNVTTGPVHLYFGSQAYGSNYTDIPNLTKYSIDATESSSNVTVWYYIESPDGSFYYPLFKTEEEANFVDTVEGGGGSSHTHTFLDDPTNTTWYMPSTNGVHAGSTAPQNGVFGNSVNVLWNEQSTEDDSNYIPTFTNITYNVQEGSAINIIYKPNGDTNTYNIQNMPSNYANNGTAIIGTAEDITNGYGQSITHTLNVTKANFFGSAQGTITINVLANLTGNEFTLVDDNGTIKFTQDGGVTLLDFNTVTFQAGQTYKFYLDGSTLQTNDIVNIVDINGNGILGNDGLTQIGPGAGYAGTHYQYVIPSDVEPGKFITFTDGATNTDYTDISLTIAGSTYVADVTGITLEGPAANQTGTNVMNQYEHGWISLNEQLSAGERLVLDNAFFGDFLAEVQGTNTVFAIGLKGDNWVNTRVINNNGAAASGGTAGNETFKGNIYIVGIWSSGASNVTMWIGSNNQLGNSLYMNSQSYWPTACAFFEITGSGNNIRAGIGRNGHAGVTQGAESTVPYSDWNSYKGQTGEQGYGISSIDVVMSFWTFNGDAINGDQIDWTQITEVAIPLPAPSIVTSWTKAIALQGANQNLKQAHGNSNFNPIRMGGSYSLVPGTTENKTVNSTLARPWATAIVFNSDRPSWMTDQQHIWNSGHGIGNNQGNIYLRLNPTGDLYFGWGRENAGYNECRIATNISSSIWYGVYIAHKGARFSSSNATVENLADAFDIRIMSSADSFASLSSNLSKQNTFYVGWGAAGASHGNRMDLGVSGEFTIGGLGYYRSFYGKVASMVVTNLLINVDMPTDTEIKLMITDPKKWEDDYRDGQLVREYIGVNTQIYNPIHPTMGYLSNMIWLMGDGQLDSFNNGVRNQVNPNDVNYSKLIMINMQSNDIETVTIPGLS